MRRTRLSRCAGTPARPLLSRRPSQRLALALLACCASAAVLGCQTPMRQALDRAEAARARGDIFDEALALRDACALSPSDTETCTRAHQTKEKAIAAAFQESDPRCAAGDIEGCLGPLERARQLRQDAELTRRLEEVARLQTARCESLPVQRPEDAVNQVRCLEALKPRIQLANYSQHVGDARNRAGAFVASKAAGKGEATRYLLLSVAACLSTDGALKTDRDGARARWLDGRRLPLQVLEKSAPPVLANACETITERLPGLRCGRAGRDAPPAASTLDVSVEVEPMRVRYEKRDELREKPYIARVDWVPNPRHHELEHQLDREHRRLREIERDESMLQADCRALTSSHHHDGDCPDADAHGRRDTACHRAKAAHELLDKTERDHRRLKRELEGTPPMLEQPVWEPFRYVEHQHRWTLDYRATARVGKGEPKPFAGLVERQALEHVGFDKANLPASPLKVPPDEELFAEARARVVDALTGTVSEAAAARGAEQLATCGATPEDWTKGWLECWAPGTLWRTGDPAPSFLDWLSARGDARYPPVRCAGAQ